jgi:hypothetical protein
MPSRPASVSVMMLADEPEVRITIRNGFCSAGTGLALKGRRVRSCPNGG